MVSLTEKLTKKEMISVLFRNIARIENDMEEMRITCDSMKKLVQYLSDYEEGHLQQEYEDHNFHLYKSGTLYAFEIRKRLRKGEW